MNNKSEDDRDSAFGPMARIEIAAVVLVVVYSLATGGLGGSKPPEPELRTQIVEEPTPQP